MIEQTTIALLSGGIDSATAACIAMEDGHRVIGLSFDYGQRHLKELQAAEALAKDLNLEDHIKIKIDLSSWGGSSLTDTSQIIPTKGIQKNTIPNTYVPGRNTIFISIGLSLAEARGANRIALGINAMDYSGYPDCRPDYLEAYQELANLSSRVGRDGKGIKLWAPLLNWEKTKIFKEALRLKIPIEKTWSCYQGGIKPCGKCDSCRIRDTVLKEIDREDLCSQNI
jgi:7-cyano-7-deazaguanine synthase